MDEGLSQVVTETFVQLYEQGLIYRGKRLVNWDPKLQTAVSDLEVETEEEDGTIWELRYPAADGGRAVVVVATTRPETMLGDVAVAVHPADERYTALVGKQLVLPLTGRTIPVIADEYVDREFGTGCVKITPAHDFNDFAIGQRHKLEPIPIFTLTATHQRERAGAVSRARPLCRAQARARADLRAAGLARQREAAPDEVPRCGRTGEVVEPTLSEQWYMAMSKPAPAGTRHPGQSIAQVALEAVARGEVRIFPEQWHTIYASGWRTSRTGASRASSGGATRSRRGTTTRAGSTSRAPRPRRRRTGRGRRSTAAARDPDVLDTWYSSAMVPFSTLGWPEVEAAGGGTRARSPTTCTCRRRCSSPATTSSSSGSRAWS